MNDQKPTPGSRLKAERELRGLSAQKAADELHLDAWVIDALEAGDYERIGPTVYAKGHLRKYAALLGLPVAEIMSDFEPQQAGTGGRDANAPVGSRHGATASGGISPGQAAATLLALILLISLAWWQPWHPRVLAPAGSVPPASTAAEMPEPGAAKQDGSGGPEVPSNATDLASPALPAGAGRDGLHKIIGPSPAAPTAAAPTARVTTTLASASRAPIAAATTAAATTAAAPSAHVPSAHVPGAVAQAGGAPSTAATGPSAGRARLTLSFSADSWVDVRDALGNRAYAGNGSANTVKTIAGAAPLHVYLRSANGVQLEINGRAVAIAPQFFSGDVARFEAGADGVLRRDASRDAAHPEPAPVRPPG